MRTRRCSTTVRFGCGASRRSGGSAAPGYTPPPFAAPHAQTQPLTLGQVLVVGMGGLAAEVAKNVVLAGVAAVTVLDHRVATEADLASQFLFSFEALGKNVRAGCACGGVGGGA